MPKSALEKYAERVAREAADWAHKNGSGMAWDDYGVHGQAGLIAAARTQIAITEALGRIKRPCL